jgi:hypothetical protein
MRSIDIRTATHEEFDAWLAEFIAAVEDGSLRAEMEKGEDPEWLARYGDASWDAALMCIGYGPLPRPRPRPGPRSARARGERRPRRTGGTDG